MNGKFLARLKALKACTSGNAMLLVALGMPMLLGGGGLAIDTAQWYMWKREMQYAVDQAALAGAWSKVNGSTGTDYQTRAQQELTANLQTVDFQGTPAITLDYYAKTADGNPNSVVVTLGASKSLPFSSWFMNHPATINVRSQASFERGRTFTSCLIAVDPTTAGAITVGGNAYVVANCGAAALSNNPEAIIKNGNPTFDVGYIVAAGGIDSGLADGGNQLYQNQAGLVDPFASLVPPNNTTPQTYSCQPATTTYTATYNDTVTVTQKTYSGTNQNNLSLTNTQTTSSATTVKTMAVNNKTKVGDQVVNTSSTQAGTVSSKTTTTTKNGKTTTTTTYTRVDTVTTDVGTVTSIATTSTAGGATPQPGTYSDFTVSCNTVMAPGVYVIDGGMLKVGAQYSLTGMGVMFVLKNGAGIDLNGGGTINLRAMTTDQMIAAGISAADALKLKDMLIFEDRNSSGNNGDKVNGNAGAILDGTVYLPKSTLTFNGTFGVVSRCLVVTASQLVIEGTTNMTSFCPSGVTNTVSVGGGVTTVRLVA